MESVNSAESFSPPYNTFFERSLNGIIMSILFIGFANIFYFMKYDDNSNIVGLNIMFLFIISITLLFYLKKGVYYLNFIRIEEGKISFSINRYDMLFKMYTLDIQNTKVEIVDVTRGRQSPRFKLVIKSKIGDSKSEWVEVCSQYERGAWNIELFKKITEKLNVKSDQPTLKSNF